MIIGKTDQYQEPFNQYMGQIGETRIWSTAKMYKDKKQWEEEKRDASLVGRWSFSGKDGKDSSQHRNNMGIDGDVVFKECKLP